MNIREDIELTLFGGLNCPLNFSLALCRALMFIDKEKKSFEEMKNFEDLKEAIFKNEDFYLSCFTSKQRNTLQTLLTRISENEILNETEVEQISRYLRLISASLDLKEIKK